MASSDYRDSLFIKGTDIVDIIKSEATGVKTLLPNGTYGPDTATTNSFVIPRIDVTNNKVSGITQTKVSVSVTHCSYCSYCTYCGQNHCTKCPQVKCTTTNCSYQSSKCQCDCDGCKD